MWLVIFGCGSLIILKLNCYLNSISTTCFSWGLADCFESFKSLFMVIPVVCGAFGRPAMLVFMRTWEWIWILLKAVLWLASKIFLMLILLKGSHQQRRRRFGFVCWNAPQGGWYKLNIYGCAVLGVTQALAVLGALSEILKGRLIQAFSCKIEDSSNIVAEGKAIEHGLNVCDHMQLNNKFDCFLCSLILSLIRGILLGIYILFGSKFWVWASTGPGFNFRHCFREENAEADALANWGCLVTKRSTPPQTCCSQCRCYRMDVHRVPNLRG